MVLEKDSNKLLQELLTRQIRGVPADKKLQYSDLKRICKYIDTSIFSEDECCLWKGYITNMNNSNKGTYINFYFRNKKVALHRLLYLNFVEGLEQDEYLKFSCDNKGKCCNINHLKRFKYQKVPATAIAGNKNNSQKSKEKSPVKIQICKKDSLTLNFW